MTHLIPMIDLHIHTNASDGEPSPKELIDKAISKGIKIIAITDHDSVSGIQEALDYSKNKEIEVVPGVEISCDEEEVGFFDVHILGLFIDHKNKELNDLLTKLKQERIIQKKEIIKKINDLGYDITFEELKKETGDSFGRPHIAKILMRKYPNFSSVSQVFSELIGKGKRAYVDQKKCLIKEAIEVIKKAGGIAILAHPAVFRLKDVPELIDLFLKSKGDGLEVYYPYDKIYNIDKKESEERMGLIKKIAEEKNLLISGGSDYHGSVRLTSLGEIKIPYSVIERLKGW